MSEPMYAPPTFSNRGLCHFCKQHGEHAPKFWNKSGKVNFEGAANYWLEKYLEADRENKAMREMQANKEAG